MVCKIISGGQTGADRSALDVAIKFNIPHGGWIPKGRKTEQGVLPALYLLRETSSSDYRERTRQNILDSHGTIIFTRGSLTGGSKLTKNIANKYNKPNYHIDLAISQDFEAAINLQSFILENQIDILNVAGTRASQDSYIYFDVKIILEALLFLFREEDNIINYFLMENDKPDVAFPKTIEEAVQIIMSELSSRILVLIARTPWEKISSIYYQFLDYIRIRIGFEQGNSLLLQSCSKVSHIPDQWFTIEDAIMEVFKVLKFLAEEQYKLSVVR